MPSGRAVATLLLLSVLVGAGCDSSSTQVAAVKKPPEIVAPGAVDADAAEEFTATESGLKYRVRRKSAGKKPGPKSVVTVHYRGWLDNGDIFDTSYGTGGKPLIFGVARVVPGWREGLQLIGEGAMIELEVPSKLGYGDVGQPPAIPGGATLHFIVELIHVGEDEKPVEATHEGHEHGPGEHDKPPKSPLPTNPADDKVPEGFTATSSGLKYKITKESTGRKPKATDKVKVHYRGKLTNGTVFDESYKRGVPAEFPLNGVIAGWTEGLQLIGEGGAIELWIPGKLGYPNGQPPTIPPGATLHFTVELLEVK